MRRIALAVSVPVALLIAATAAHATFPYPPPPPGTAPQDYAAYLRLPSVSPPVRPVDFTGGTEWKLTSDPPAIPRSTPAPRSCSASAA